MKEAAGEANMTVITITLIAVVLVVGTFMVNNLMTRTQKNSSCSALGGKYSGGSCCFSDENKCYTFSKCTVGNKNSYRVNVTSSSKHYITEAQQCLEG